MTSLDFFHELKLINQFINPKERLYNIDALNKVLSKKKKLVDFERANNFKNE